MAEDETIIVRGVRHVVTDCGMCGVVYTVPKVRYDNMRAEGGFAFCPNGHAWGWREGTRQRDQLRLERDRLKQKLAEKDDEIARVKKSASAIKGEYTKVKNRIAAGVCPCCNRSFANLHRHMKAMHPYFKTAEVVPLKSA